jgi:hypothetical protein
MFSLQQNWRTREQNRFCLEAGVGGMAQTMHTIVSKCKSVKKNSNIPIINGTHLKIINFWDNANI